MPIYYIFISIYYLCISHQNWQYKHVAYLAQRENFTNAVRCSTNIQNAAINYNHKNPQSLKEQNHEKCSVAHFISAVKQKAHCFLVTWINATTGENDKSIEN